VKLYSKDHFGNNIQGRDQQILRTSVKQEYNFHNDIGVIQSKYGHKIHQELTSIDRKPIK